MYIRSLPISAARCEHQRTCSGLRFGGTKLGIGGTKLEQQKEELGKLKELGNGILGKFGMSLDNFKAEKDPATGSYNISFQQ